jgi:HlyD family secretion protein
MNIRRLVIIVVVIAVLVAGGYLAYTQFLAPDAEDAASAEATATAPTDVDTISVNTGLNVVTAEGQVVPLSSTQLSFQSGGEIVELLVAEGDLVNAGDALIRLDTTDQELAVEQAKAAVVQAEANIQTAEAGLLAAQAGLTASEVARDTTIAQLALLEAGATAEQVALGESDVAVADAGVTLAAGNRDASLEGATGAAIAAAEAQVSAAQAQYNAAIRTYQPITQDGNANAEDREQAQLQINAAQANLNAAQAALERLRGGPSSAAQVAANSGVSVASNQRDAAQANLDLLLADPLEQQIAVAESAVTQAENQLSEAELQVSNAQTAVSQAEAALVEATAVLATAQRALERRTLTAPFAATVAALPVKEHEVASPAVPVITLADFSEWRVETTDLSEADVVNIARDFPVEITLDAFPGETITGHVIDIASNSNLIRGDVTYVTTIALDDDKGLPLRWGMTTFVMIDTE